MLTIRMWIIGVAFMVIGLLAVATVPDLLRGDYYQLCMNFSPGDGFGPPHYRARCVKWAAERGDAFRQFELGDWYADGFYVSQDHSEAVRWWRRAAQAGFAPAQLRLADSYFEGRGVEEEALTGIEHHQGAAHWYGRAAEQGAPLAWLRLAFMYEHGVGIEQDDFIALRWYRRAAEYGFLSAMLNLGDRYAAGRTVPQDYVQAHKWFNLAGSGAAASEEALRDRAIRARERVAAAMTPEQIAEAQRLAREWESSTWTPPAQRAGSAPAPERAEAALEFILGLIVLALDIWAIINIVRSAASTGAKILWTLLIVILPVIGFIVWFFAGLRPRASPA